MIIFAVRTNMELSQKPEWLDAFRRKYDDLRYDYHVTLKQPSVILENDIAVIRGKLSEYFEKKNTKPIDLSFDKLVLDNTRMKEDEGCIMIKTEKNEEIFKLQKNIIEILGSYTNYVWLASKEYEEQFVPHITIARNLDEEKFKLAESDLKPDYFCEGEVTKVVLSIIYNFDPRDESKNFSNDFEYILKK